MIRYILLDIEGTTTDIDFVHKVLFPYSAQHLSSFVTFNAANPEVQDSLQAVKDTVQQEENRSIDDREAMETLLRWIQADRKHTALKELQGLIWKQGYVQGDYQGHVYEDVPEALERWTGEGLKLGIYSSGSVQAQQLIFGYTAFGDLNTNFSDYFDTRIGGKKEAESYRKIAQALEMTPPEILFLSDNEEELEAAAQAGMRVIQLVRGNTKPSTQFPTTATFKEIELPATVSA